MYTNIQNQIRDKLQASMNVYPSKTFLSFYKHSDYYIMYMYTNIMNQMQDKLQPCDMRNQGIYMF